MCSRFTQTSEVTALRARFKLKSGEAVAMPPKYNIAPSSPALVAVAQPGGPALETRHWGLVPSWAKSLDGLARPINARSEGVASSAMFRHLLPARRCLVLADSFYEWTGGKHTRRPMRIQLKSKAPFAFAGLWDSWTDSTLPGSPELQTFTILTTAPNDTVRPIHDRMPVILAAEDEERWLDPSLTAVDRLQRLLVPFVAEPMEAYEVSPLVNSPRNQGPECIRPAAQLSLKLFGGTCP